MVLTIRIKMNSTLRAYPHANVAGVLSRAAEVTIEKPMSSWNCDLLDPDGEKCGTMKVEGK